jgi:manganese transport system ATP-binding protein
MGDMDTLAVHGRGVVVARGAHVALQASDFDIPAGRITAIIGPNGGGKSTLLHAIAGLLPTKEGALSVLGRSPVQARDEVSYVLQYTTVPAGTPITVTEAVAMGRFPSIGMLRRASADDRAKVAAAMDRLNITDLARRQLTELSGGQRQRVYVAQGIAQDHKLLLLDEPLTGLDITSMQTIDAIIHDEPEHGCTVVLTTHDLDEARAADHVLLTAGRVVAYGPPAQVLTPANLTAAYGLGVLHENDRPTLVDDHHHHHEGDRSHSHPHDHAHGHSHDN